jgi:hypothetical protein
VIRLLRTFLAWYSGLLNNMNAEYDKHLALSSKSDLLRQMIP